MSAPIPSIIRRANEAEQAQLMELVESLQIRDMQRMYNGLTERCFNQCVNNFRSR